MDNIFFALHYNILYNNIGQLYISEHPWILYLLTTNAYLQENEMSCAGNK